MHHPRGAALHPRPTAGCCGGSDLLSKMCGERSTCGVILVVVGVFVLFLVAVCTMGGFCWR